MNSWDDRVWSLPVSERTGASAITSTSQHRKKTMSPRERSASAMLFIATAALLSALAAIGLMHKADRRAAVDAPSAAAAPADPSPLAAPVAPPVAAPVAAPIAAPVAIDMDDVKPTPAAVPSAPAPAPAPKTVAAAPANGDRAYATPAYAAPANAAPAPAQTKPAKEKAPASSAQQKALEDLLDQLGEEQLKR
jgi:hypothetical protein